MKFTKLISALILSAFTLFTYLYLWIGGYYLTLIFLYTIYEHYKYENDWQKRQYREILNKK